MSRVNATTVTLSLSTKSSSQREMLPDLFTRHQMRASTSVGAPIAEASLVSNCKNPSLPASPLMIATRTELSTTIISADPCHRRTAFRWASPFLQIPSIFTEQSAPACQANGLWRLLGSRSILPQGVKHDLGHCPARLPRQSPHQLSSLGVANMDLILHFGSPKARRIVHMYFRARSAISDEPQANTTGLRILSLAPILA